MTSTNRRLAESTGMLMIGDGVLGLVYPREHCLLWSGGPQWWRDTIMWFASHPGVTRAFAASELAAGLWLARRQEPALPQYAADAQGSRSLFAAGAPRSAAS